jgi:acetyl-CoA carboxylase biotin carboxyl carrier protein
MRQEDQGAEPAAGDVFDLDQLRRLVQLMEEHGLGEVDLRDQRRRVRLRRAGLISEVPAAAAVPAAAPAGSSELAAAPPPTAELEDGPHIAYITSPMVGTFYRRPSPKADLFVDVGSRVTSDSVCCIIEAMKVFNEIPAEVSGKIVAVLVNDEEPVDFGRRLFKVDTRG